VCVCQIPGYLEDLDVGWRIILKWIFSVGW